MTKEIKQKAREEFDKYVDKLYLDTGHFFYHKENTWNLIDSLLSQALQKQKKELIEIIKTPMSTEFEDPEEESADYSIEDFRARLLNLIKQD